LYVLDNCGRVTEERDWGGVVWRYRYDADGLCTARVNGLEETILYSRDAAGRLAEIITPEGKTQYAYDKSGRLTGIFSPDGISQRTGKSNGPYSIVQTTPLPSVYASRLPWRS
ncbi:RHS repeat domain-containing protein, partial [Bacillus sp. HC-Mk]